MKTMKLRDKKIYLNKLIDYLADNGWDKCNYAKQPWSECDELRSMTGTVLIHERFDVILDIVELFEEGKSGEAMDLYNEAIGETDGGSMSEYYDGVLSDNNPWHA